MKSDDYISKYASDKGSLSNTIGSKYVSKMKKINKVGDMSLKGNIKKKIKDAGKIKNYFLNKDIKYNLDSRIFYYNHIRKKIKNISSNQCLSASISGNAANTTYSIKDTIMLTRRFGTSSEYGYVYIAKIKNEIGKRPIAAKLMVRNYRNLLETSLNEKITKEIVKSKISRHFILTYKVIYCNTISNINLPNIINNDKYIILLNELARGDYKSLCLKKDFLKNNEVLYNIFIQMMLSIMTLHSFGYVHRDCHWGNFLYQYNNEKGYYQYRINGKVYYLKSCDYSIYLYDFGIAKKISEAPIKNIAEDYVRITGAFRNKNNYNHSWLSKINIANNLPSKDISVFALNFKNKIINLEKNNITGKDAFLNKITQELIDVFLKIPNNIFTDKKPLNAKIINAGTFNIDN